MKNSLNNKIFRFRTLNNLIDKYKELEEQTIYFAEPEQLNDPMEGYRDIFWSGDSIIWKNFFKHYLLCLERMCSLLIICGEEHPMSVENIPVFSGELDFPTTEYKEIFNKISSVFFDNKNLMSLINKISARSTPIRRDELTFYFETIKPIAVEAIFHVYRESGIFSGYVPNANSNDSLIKVIESDYIGLVEKLIKENNGSEKHNDLIHLVQRHALTQMDIIFRFNGTLDCSLRNKNLVFVEFTDAYINQIEKLIYPDWFAACFMSDCTNSSLWGHYGDKHRGVCLVFNPVIKGTDYFLNLKGVNGFNKGGNTYGWQLHKLTPIDYENGYGQIDFFRSLGRLSRNILDSVWFRGDGEVSSCADEMYKSENDWREKYWNNFYRDISSKTKDWKYENELRIILSSSLDSFSEKKDRNLMYDFKSLHGLIFGIKTKTEDKIKIMKIIKQKCKETNRNDFKFFQAFYSNEDKSIDYYEMNFIKFNDQV